MVSNMKVGLLCIFAVLNLDTVSSFRLGHSVETNRTARFRGGTATSDYTYSVAIRALDSAGTSFRLCSGALLTRSLAITAASCVVDASSINIRAGGNDLTAVADPEVETTGSALIYPKFKYNKFEHDVALIQLNSPFTLSTTISTITLPSTLNTKNWYDSADFEGKTLRAIGYGGNAAGVTDLIRNYADMTVMTAKACYLAMDNLYFDIYPSLSCLSNSGGTPCAADKGGPVTEGGTIVGIISQFIKCSDPAVFTRIGPYLSWIRKNAPEL